MANFLMLILPVGILKLSKPLSRSFARYAFAILLPVFWIILFESFYFPLYLLLQGSEDAVHVLGVLSILVSVPVRLIYPQFLNLFCQGSCLTPRFFCNSAGSFLETFGLLATWMTSTSMFVFSSNQFLEIPRCLLSGLWLWLGSRLTPPDAFPHLPPSSSSAVCVQLAQEEACKVFDVFGPSPLYHCPGSRVIPSDSQSAVVAIHVVDSDEDIQALDEEYMTCANPTSCISDSFRLLFCWQSKYSKCR